MTQVNPDGSIVTVSGDWNGQQGDEPTFASTSHVMVNQPAYDGTVGSYSNVMANTISGFISLAGLPASSATAPALTPEGSQAFLYPDQQHFVNADSAGNVRHHWWDVGSQSITTDTWGTGIVAQRAPPGHAIPRHRRPESPRVLSLRANPAES